MEGVEQSHQQSQRLGIQPFEVNSKTGRIILSDDPAPPSAPPDGGGQAQFPPNPSAAPVPRTPKKTRRLQTVPSESSLPFENDEGYAVDNPVSEKNSSVNIFLIVLFVCLCLAQAFSIYSSVQLKKEITQLQAELKKAEANLIESKEFFDVHGKRLAELEGQSGKFSSYLEKVNKRNAAGKTIEVRMEGVEGDLQNLNDFLTSHDQEIRQLNVNYRAIMNLLSKEGEVLAEPQISDGSNQQSQY